ncbi:4-hydroxy-3-methylbut-2-en-1-yl diphosphate synthase [Campylobacter sp. JMF_06 NA1]|uniref:4-hydroxy-3-methylbut-2-en-1-yl diphosphate synthase n=1 Tax=Campylobacter sp. JMF_06 NA1 TaxID=2983823 RepID=UPI0022E9AD3C|nr:4-hydroxy-3-methylbut-2-en-1-yl diphosphate synthase [Campylobacter sp. JMF_06 NA1]MDA3077871.1 4-hydroxy-3-methylbut-2-en-1-yl diphosphate synthase [Campylobacter sp. JMF_06 NA1]
MAQNKKTLWPYGIAFSIVAIIAACVATIIFSLDYPVHSDNFYFDKYQKVDENYNEIQLKQQNFEKKYEVNFEISNPQNTEKFSLNLPIKAKNNAKFDKISAEILLTRPDSTTYDKRLNTQFLDGVLRSENFSIEKLGRWQVMAKISDSIDTGFYKFEFNATKTTSGIYDLQILEGGRK